MTQKKLFLDELENKIINQSEFSKKYVQHFSTLYKLPSDYSIYTSELAKIKCLLKDDVEIIFACLKDSGANFDFFGIILFRKFFERTTWFVKEKINPFDLA